MEPSNNDSIPGQPREVRLRPHLMGLITLVLLFCASASVTLAYLSDAPSAGAAAQTAAVATPALPDPFAALDLQAKAVYVKDLTTGKILYASNASAQLPLASLTKVATVLAVSEVLPLNTVITIPYDTAPPGSAERLAAGERWHLSDVISFTLIASSNDGADILAAAANSSVHAKYPQSPAASATLWRMNNLAQQLGLNTMYFLNTNGLDISTTQAGAYGSAYDVATLLSYAASKSPAVFEGTTQDTMSFTSLDGAQTSAFNTDLALSAIPGLVMGKTGYTDLAGGNLAVIFNIGLSHPVVAVVLGSTYDGRFSDMKQLVADSEKAVSEGL